jgi:hypothetical protein
MHDPRVPHQEDVYQILRYLKSYPGKGVLFSKSISKLKSIQMLIELDVSMIESQPQVIVHLLGIIWFLRGVRNRTW